MNDSAAKRRRGHPYAENPLSERIKTMVNSETMTAIANGATAEHVTLSQWVRVAIHLRLLRDEWGY
jgi:hypothetical protein